MIARRHEQRDHHHDAEAAVVEEAVDHHRAQTDQTREDAGGELVAGQRRTDGLHARVLLERDRQRAVAQAGRQALGRVLVEAAADLGLAVGDDAVHRGRRDHLAVEHDREQLLGAVEGARDLRELLGAAAVEVEVDDPVHVVLRDAGRRVVEVGALHHRDREQELLALVVAGEERAASGRHPASSCPSWGRRSATGCWSRCRTRRRRRRPPTSRRGCPSTSAGRRCPESRHASPVAPSVGVAVGAAGVRGRGAVGRAGRVGRVRGLRLVVGQERRAGCCRCCRSWSSSASSSGSPSRSGARHRRPETPTGSARPSHCRTLSGAADGAAAPRPLCATTRNRSWACRSTVSTRSRRLFPGISTTTYWLPSVVTSASATPVPLTRWLMMLAASLRFSDGHAVAGGRQADPGAAFEVEAERRGPGTAHGHQAVHGTHDDEEDGQGARRTGGTASHVSAPRSWCRGRARRRTRPARSSTTPRAA